MIEGNFSQTIDFAKPTTEFNGFFVAVDVGENTILEHNAFVMTIEQFVGLVLLHKVISDIFVDETRNCTSEM